MSWEIDAIHSHVSFSVRHMMVSMVRGNFGVLSGELHIDEENPAQSWVNAQVDASSINTNNEQRDGHLRSADFFDTEKYPLITFKSTKIEHISDQDYTITGDFTMHGVTRQIAFRAEYNGQSNMMGKQRAGLSAKTKINRKDFDLSWGSAIEAGQVAVSEQVTIEIDLETTQKAVEPQEAASAS